MESGGAGVKDEVEQLVLYEKDENSLKEENERLKRQLDEIRQVARKVHEAVVELDSLICL